MIDNNLKKNYLLYLSLFFLISLIMSVSPTLEQGDTLALLNGVDAAIKCIDSKELYNCKENIIHFPIFQYLIGYPLKKIGFNSQEILKVFIHISSITFLASLVCYYRVGYKYAGQNGGILSILLILSGYLTWYSRSTFNESAAFFLFTYLVYLIIMDGSLYKLLLTILLCVITKEVAAPIIIYILLITFLFKHGSIDKGYIKLLKLNIILVIPILIGVLINTLFNYLRFGVFYNKFNVDPILMANLKDTILNFIYLFVSPNSGLIFVWTSLFFLIVLEGLILLKSNDYFKKLLFWIILLGIAFVNLGLAKWFSPFGWVTWGPRLTLPYLGGFVLLMVTISIKDISTYLQNLKPNQFLIYFLFISNISFLINIGALIDTSIIYNHVFSPTKTIIESGISPFAVQIVPREIFFKGLHEQMSRFIPLTIYFDIFLRNITFLILFELNLFLLAYFYIKNRSLNYEISKK